MKSDSIKTDFRYQYIEELCQAIEKFTRKKETENIYAFQYRTVNLKFAIERYLYFKFVDNPRLYHWFCQAIQNKSALSIQPRSKIEQEIALCLLQSLVELKNYQCHPFSWFGNLLSCLWYKLLDLLWKLNPSPQLKSKQVNVLIWLNQVKHARYLLPITNTLTTSYSYLLVGRREKQLNPFLKNHKLPAINIRGISVQSCFKSSQLQHFRELTLYCDRLFAGLEILKPKCMILVEGNSPIDEITNQVCQKLSIATVCLQHGWSPIIHNGFRNMSYSKMLVWGQGFANLLKPYNLQQRYVVTGSYIVNQNTNNDDSLGGISFFLQSPHKLCSLSSWQQILSLIALTADKFPTTPILVREHPNYSLAVAERKNLLQFSNIKFVVSSQYSLNDVFKNSILTISVFSTTILESIAMGVVPIIFNNTSMPNYCPDLQQAGVAIEVKNIDEALNVIERVMFNQVYREKLQLAFQNFQREYFNIIPETQVNVTSKIVKEILKYC